MNWGRVAVGLGHVMGILNRARRLRDGQAARVAALAVSVGLLLARPVGAGDSYPAATVFADDLTAQSSWEQVLAKPGIQAEFPMVNFGASFVPLSSLCAEGAMLRIADPRLDNGVRVSAGAVGGPHRARVTTGYAAMRADLFGVSDVGGAASPDQTPSALIRYPVSVYRIFQRPLSTERVFLFEKPWEIPACPAR